jgi:hypothetical protein
MPVWQFFKQVEQLNSYLKKLALLVLQPQGE